MADGEKVVSLRLIAYVSDGNTTWFRYQLLLDSGHVIVRDYHYAQEGKTHTSDAPRVELKIGPPGSELTPRQRAVAKSDLLEAGMDIIEED